MTDENAVVAKRPSAFDERQRRLRLVMKAMDDKLLVTVPEIAAATGLSESTVQKAMGEIMKARMDGFKSKPMQELVAAAAHNYLIQTREALKCLTQSTSQFDKRGAIKLLKDVQDSQNHLFKMCGIYKEVKELQISIKDVAESDEGKQFIDMFLDFLAVKGIDPAEFKNYVIRRNNGEFQPIVLEERRVHPAKAFDDRDADNIGEYAVARKKERSIRDDLPDVTEYVPGESDVTEIDLEVLDVDDMSRCEAKLMNGTLTDEEEEMLLSALSDEGVEEWERRKKALTEPKDTNEEGR